MYRSTPIRQSYVSAQQSCTSTTSSLDYKLKTPFNPFAITHTEWHIYLQMAIVEWQIEPINLASSNVALAVIKHGQNGLRREALIIE